MLKLFSIGVRELPSGQVVELGIRQVGVGEHPFRPVHERGWNQDAISRFDPGDQLGRLHTRRNALGTKDGSEGLSRPAIGEDLERLPILLIHAFTTHA
jgi:hypothetical protein